MTPALARALRNRHLAESFASLAAWSLALFVCASITTLAASVTRWHEVIAFGCASASLVAYVMSLAAESRFEAMAQSALSEHVDIVAGSADSPCAIGEECYRGCVAERGETDAR